MKTIFWNVDTQYDFMKPEGKLYVTGAEAIEPNLVKLTQLAEVNKIKVVNTGDWHNPDSEELSDNPDFMNTFPQHCMANSPGAKFIPATNPKNPYIINWEDKDIDAERVLQERNILLYKDAFNVFEGNPHANRIVELFKSNRVERAIVYGVATNVCVDFAVNGLLERKVQVYVPIDAIKELPNLPLPYKGWQEKGAIFTDVNKIYKMLENAE